MVGETKMLEQIAQLLWRQSGLLENIGKSSLGQCSMHGDDRSKCLVSDSTFERNVTSFLPQLNETGSFQRTHKALAGDARQLCHFTWRRLRMSRKPDSPWSRLRGLPKFPGKVQSLLGGLCALIPHPGPATSRSAPDNAPHTIHLLW